MGLSGSHILILVLIVLLVFGASKLPNAARSLGRSMRIFKSEMDEMKTDSNGNEVSQQQAIDQQKPQANQIDDQVQIQPPEKHPESNGR